jgi:hypothetical protein
MISLRLLQTKLFHSFDIDLPIECDDEYWYPEDTTLAFKQPLGKASRTSYFIQAIRLRLIHLRVMRRLVSACLSCLDCYSLAIQFAAGSIPRLELHQNTLAEIDSDLNQWNTGLPHYRRPKFAWASLFADLLLSVQWDVMSSAPDKEIGMRRQAACLKVEQNHLLIGIHRPFVIPTRTTSGSSTSLAICINAARSNARLFSECDTKFPMIVSLDRLVHTTRICSPGPVIGVCSELSSYSALQSLGR